MPDAGQRLASKEAIFSHAFILQEPEAVTFWENVAANNEFDSDAYQALGMKANVYVKEVLSLIDLSTDEQIDGEDGDDADEEALTAEQ